MSPAEPSGILCCLSRLARFKADGLAGFTATPAAFLNSLAPLLAFPLIGGVFLLLTGATHDAIANLLTVLVALLGPPVLSHGLARRWRQEARWLRYATAFNWCQTAITLVVLLLVVALFSADHVSLASGTAIAGTALGGVLSLAVYLLLGYWLALSWFVASRGLGVSWWRAILVVLVINLGTAVLTIGPSLVGATRT